MARLIVGLINLAKASGQCWLPSSTVTLTTSALLELDHRLSFGLRPRATHSLGGGEHCEEALGSNYPCYFSSCKYNALMTMQAIVIGYWQDLFVTSRDIPFVFVRKVRLLNYQILFTHWLSNSVSRLPMDGALNRQLKVSDHDLCKRVDHALETLILLGLSCLPLVYTVYIWLSGSSLSLSRHISLLSLELVL